MFAAPFVRLVGVNGILWLNVVLLAGIVWCAYRFVAARSPAGSALAYALAFVGASIAPLYVVWLSAEVFNLSVVFFAYFLWCYRWSGWTLHAIFPPETTLDAALIAFENLFGQPALWLARRACGARG